MDSFMTDKNLLFALPPSKLLEEKCIAFYDLQYIRSHRARQPAMPLFSLMLTECRWKIP